MYYTYILESQATPEKRYIGHTSDLKQRIAQHNAGHCSHTSKYRPWELTLYIAFQNLTQAQHFERYLKSGSGHAFANRHFWNSR
jgi:predicted GIY-YIG superfamily endonuclease